MNEIKPLAESDQDDNKTGLPWPKSWKGAYLFVLASFVLWVVLLVVLTRFGS